MEPYVVSQDLGLILSGQGLPKDHFATLGISKGHEQILPDIRRRLGNVLSEIFPNFIYLVEADLAKKFQDKVADMRSAGIPVVSLDRIYADQSLNGKSGQYFLDVTRVYHPNGVSELRGRLNSKYSELAPDEMVSGIARHLKANGYNRIAMADDVIFSGGSVVTIAQNFERQNILVTDIISCVAIEGGMRALANSGIHTDSIYQYPNVLDQVCERDFFVGMSQAGVLMMADGSLKKCPYLMPYGDPMKRASIPAHLAMDVSHDLLQLSADLWTGLEDLNSKKIYGRDLPESIYMIDPDRRLVDTLREHAHQLITGVFAPPAALALFKAGETPASKKDVRTRALTAVN